VELGVSCTLRYRYEAVYVSIFCARSEVLIAVLMNIQIVWFVKAELVCLLHYRYLISIYFVVHSMQKEIMTIYMCVCVCVCACARARLCGNVSFGALRPPNYYFNFRGLKSYV